MVVDSVLAINDGVYSFIVCLQATTKKKEETNKKLPHKFHLKPITTIQTMPLCLIFSVFSTPKCLAAAENFL